MSVMKKIITLICTILIVVTTLFTIVFFNEFNTSLSVDKITDTNNYYVDVEGNYYLDDFIKAGGADSSKNLSNFLSIAITKGCPLVFDVDATYNHVSSTVGTNDSTMMKSAKANSNVLVVKTSPFDRYSSISTVDLSYLNVEELDISNNLLAMAATYFPLDGINEKGLSASVLLTPREGHTNPSNSSDTDVTETVMLRMILDNASTIKEAQTLIENHDLFASGKNEFEFVITDSSGDCLNYKFISKGDFFATEIYYTKNEITELSDIVKEDNFSYGVVYNRVDLTADYYFTKDATKSSFTVKL